MGRKWMCMLLAAAMVLGLGMPAFAAEGQEAPPAAEVIEPVQEAAPMAEEAPVPETPPAEEPAPPAETEDAPEAAAVQAVTVSITGEVDSFQRLGYFGTDGSHDIVGGNTVPAGVTALVYVSPQYSVSVDNGTITGDRYDYGANLKRVYIPELEETDGPFLNADGLNIYSRVFEIAAPGSGTMTVHITPSDDPLPELIPITFYNQNEETYGGMDEANDHWVQTAPDGTRQQVIATGSTLKILIKNGYDLQVLEGGQILETGAPTMLEWHSDCMMVTVRVDLGAKKLVMAAVKKGETFTPPEEEQDTDVVFTDVVEDAWYADTVLSAYEKGIVKGVTENTFSPNGTTTRGQTVTMLYRAMGSPGGANVFSDTSGEVGSAAGWAASAGVTTGVSGTTFAPNSAVTREQLVTMLYRLAGSPAASSASLGSYTDGGAVQSYAKDAVAWAVGNGLLTGYGDGSLKPGATATRAEVCALVMRYLGA